MELIRLRYGNTGTFFLRGEGGGLLVDTDMAGTLPAFYRALKANGVGPEEISFVMATHFHPDHAGLVGEIALRGAKLLLLESQVGLVHFPDRIFARDPRLAYKPVDEKKAKILSFRESRAFLASLGIAGEIVPTPSHSADSVSLILDTGEALVGDLEPLSYLAAYEENQKLEKDWKTVLARRPRRIFYAHAGEETLSGSEKDLPGRNHGAL